ncbi:MAG: M1 family aminopeptidase [Cyclobacteriaceae bacterium]
MRKVLSIFLILVGFISAAQDTYKRNPVADVQNYRFRLKLNDQNNIIEGETTIAVNFSERPTVFELDLIGKSETYGMEVLEVLENDREASYTFVDNKISITPSLEQSGTGKFTVRYKGIPERGLVIDTTKFGQRSFFGDNWPTLARHWLPGVDHPYDKASIEFVILAPEHYDVVATGSKVEESNLGDGNKLTRYYEPAPVALKVVTIGVTKFASKLLDSVDGIPVSAWVYPENRLEGFSDYAISTKVLKYFIDNVGPYSYSKLANMQAKTQWGGLENAGNIAYFENSVTGNNTVEGLIAHEIAHQWFGNSATENSWNHVWLSEGFATYFAILYLESAYGDNKRKEELITDRQQVITYFKKNPSPVVDNTISDPMKVLSTNTYQKGGWVLNMLRKKLGDEIFWNGIQAYYTAFKDSNALTEDFHEVMEKESGLDLDRFFQQWIHTKGYPEISWEWAYKKGKLLVKLEQLQNHHVFEFPLEFGIKTRDGMRIETIQVSQKSQSFEIALETKPVSIEADPGVWLLFEEK